LNLFIVDWWFLLILRLSKRLYQILNQLHFQTNLWNGSKRRLTSNRWSCKKKQKPWTTSPWDSERELSKNTVTKRMLFKSALRMSVSISPIGLKAIAFGSVDCIFDIFVFLRVYPYVHFHCKMFSTTKYVFLKCPSSNFLRLSTMFSGLIINLSWI
jgi:hypothetical protein